MTSKRATYLLSFLLVLVACGGAGGTAANERPAGLGGTAGNSPAKSNVEDAILSGVVVRRAVIVGINEYGEGRISPESPRDGCRKDNAWSNLDGAVNDARAFYDVLTGRYGFAPENVRLLVDQEASREAIVHAIEEILIGPSREGDHAAFLFFGHGSQVLNSKSQELDRHDESLVPADSWRGAPDLRDKELRRMFNRVLDRGASLTVLLDSCHSGSGVRGIGLRPRQIEADRCDAADVPGTDPAPEERGALILSAVRDEQLSFEVWEPLWRRHHGAFSLAMLRALRMSAKGEPALEVFHRAEAVLRTLRPHQDPVIAGGDSARTSGLFGEDGIRRAESTATVLDVDLKGRILLQGGWIHGLAENSELVGLDRRNGIDPVRLRVTALDGLSRSRAEVVGGSERTATSEVETGALFALVGWSSPPGPPLPVWIPTGEVNVNRWAVGLRRAAAEAGIGLSRDPTELPAPSHLVSWSEGTWYLSAPDGTVTDIGPKPETGEVIDRLRAAPPPVQLQVQLAVPSALKSDLGLGTGTLKIESAEDPRRAKYTLWLRFRTGGGLEAAWVLNGISPEDTAASQLPVRSRWVPLDPARPESVADAAAELTLDASGLARVYSWLELESPKGNAFAYSLSLQGSGVNEGEEVRGEVIEGRRYGFALKATDDFSADVRRRFVYVFVIDSAGRCQLIYPPDAWGQAENLVPVSTNAQYPTHIRLQPHPILEVVEPLGTDSYYLLATGEKLRNPWVLNCPGVRGENRDLSGLEELLLQTGSETRSGKPLYTPAPWSLQRLEVRSVTDSSDKGQVQKSSAGASL